jgi:hypothetical protein
MTLQITFSPETESQLRQKALAAGKDIEGFVRQAVEEKLSTEKLPALESTSRDQWLKRFDAWIASHPLRPNVQLDDSRQSIYAGRGE